MIQCDFVTESENPTWLVQDIPKIWSHRYKIYILWPTFSPWTRKFNCIQYPLDLHSSVRTKKIKRKGRERERESRSKSENAPSSSSNHRRIKIQVTLKNELKKEKINLGKIKTPNQSSMETMKKWIKLKTLAGVKEDVGK